LIVLSAEVFHKAFCRCVPVRIGLAAGQFRVDSSRSMFAGPALIDAYRSGEQAQWLGISLSDEMAKEALPLRMKTGGSNVVVPWKLPTKAGWVDRHVVNWPAVYSHDFKIKPPISIDQLYAGFLPAYGPFDRLPAAVQAKYRNTVEFVNRRLEIHRTKHLGSPNRIRST
jgi:hypothetical protein